MVLPAFPADEVVGTVVLVVGFVTEGVCFALDESAGCKFIGGLGGVEGVSSRIGYRAGEDGFFAVDGVAKY